MRSTPSCSPSNRPRCTVTICIGLADEGIDTADVRAVVVDDTGQHIDVERAAGALDLPAHRQCGAIAYRQADALAQDLRIGHRLAVDTKHPVAGQQAGVAAGPAAFTSPISGSL